MKNSKNNKGITLIALVVTIIVLLILAGVSLNLVAGSNGIIGKAEKAVSETQKAALKEDAELAIAELQMQYYLSYDGNKGFVDFVKEQCPIETSNRGRIYLNNNELYYENSDGFMKLSEQNGNLLPGEVENGGGMTPQPQKYTVTYNANGGEGSMPGDLRNIAQGTNVTVDTTAVLTKSGCKFLGWALTNDATAGITEFTMPGENVTLYAVWHTHNYVATELKDCSDEIKNNYSFCGSSSRWNAPDFIINLEGMKSGDIVYMETDSINPNDRTTVLAEKGYYTLTSSMGSAGWKGTRIGDSYYIKVCSCGDYYKE